MSTEIQQNMKVEDPIVKKWEENYERNIKEKIFSQPRVRSIKFLITNDFYTRSPFVLVAAGPSLDKNISILKEKQENYIIVCADVVLYRLVEEGISPDFIVSIDPSDSLPRFWKGVDTSTYNYICPTTTSSIALQEWKGSVFMFNQTDIPGTDKQKILSQLTRRTSGFGELMNRFFVGATMFQFAQLFSPSCILLVGYDFGFDKDKVYCNGFLDRKLYDDNNVGMDILRKNEAMSDISIQVDDSYVKTTRLLELYKKTLVDLIHTSKSFVINSTEGGILTETLRMPLEDSITEYCPKKIDKVDVTKLKARRRKKR